MTNNKPTNPYARSTATAPDKNIENAGGATSSNTSNGNNSSNNNTSGFGDINIQANLYKTNLENIFNDYQKNIASLESEKQESIQDAYYVRELSKKYLGEYASNAGINDVSGNLIDIYGNYQDNITDINNQYASLELSYKEAMENEMQETEQNQMLSEINYNLATGLIPNGMSEVDYLTSVRSYLGEENYWNLMTEYKGIEMTDTINTAVGNALEYNSQEEWDSYIDELFENKSINSTQAEFLREQYEVQQNTNFTLDSTMSSKDVDYYNPNGLQIVEDGKVYTSYNGKNILAETSNVIDSSSASFTEINEIGSGKDFKEPFAVGGLYYVKNADGTYTEYVISKDINHLTENTTVVYKDNEDLYNKINSELKGGSGVVDNVAYTSTTNGYTAYVNFEATHIGNEKGNINIDGVDYEFDKKDRVTTYKGLFNDGYGSVKNDYNDNNSENGEILRTLADKYFKGSFEEMFDNVFSGNPQDKEHTYVVVNNGKYYTINDGQLFELRKTK